LSVFEQILQKAKREFGIVGVALFNWTEPFLHPDLPEFIRCVKRENLICTLSSNLNLIRRADDVLLAKPDTLRISLSGYTQAIYGQTHVHGEIETVKRNMRLLSEAKKRLRNRRTAIYVYYHKYLHNLDEVEPMKQFARSLGFDWLEDWAYYMPLERVIELAEGRLSPEKKRFVDDHLALPIDKAIDEARLFKKEACGLLHDQIVLDAAGDIHICCAAYEKRTTRLGRFLEMTPDEVRNAKTRHPLCARCSAHGLHRYFEYTTHPILRKKYAALVEEKLSRTQR